MLTASPCNPFCQFRFLFFFLFPDWTLSLALHVNSFLMAENAGGLCLYVIPNLLISVYFCILLFFVLYYLLTCNPSIKGANSVSEWRKLFFFFPGCYIAKASRSHLPLDKTGFQFLLIYHFQNGSFKLWRFELAHFHQSRGKTSIQVIMGHHFC